MAWWSIPPSTLGTGMDLSLVTHTSDRLIAVNVASRSDVTHKCFCKTRVILFDVVQRTSALSMCLRIANNSKCQTQVVGYPAREALVLALYEWLD